jgi:hypothetical protein
VEEGPGSRRASGLGDIDGDCSRAEAGDPDPEAARSVAEGVAPGECTNDGKAGVYLVVDRAAGRRPTQACGHVCRRRLLPRECGSARATLGRAYGSSKAGLWSESRLALASSRKLLRVALGKMPMCKLAPLGEPAHLGFSVRRGSNRGGSALARGALDRSRRSGPRELRPAWSHRRDSRSCPRLSSTCVSISAKPVRSGVRAGSARRARGG